MALNIPRKVAEKMSVYSDEEKALKSVQHTAPFKKKRKLSYSDKLALRFQLLELKRQMQK